MGKYDDIVKRIVGSIPTDHSPSEEYLKELIRGEVPNDDFNGTTKTELTKELNTALREHFKDTYLHVPHVCWCYKTGCMWCDGGLFYCIRCGSFEGATTTDCPGTGMDQDLTDRVYNGHIDYVRGEWVVEPSVHTAEYFKWVNENFCKYEKIPTEIGEVKETYIVRIRMISASQYNEEYPVTLYRYGSKIPIVLSCSEFRKFYRPIEGG